MRKKIKKREENRNMYQLIKVGDRYPSKTF